MNTPKTLTLNPDLKDCVVDGVEAFISGIDMSKYEHLKPNDGRIIVKEFKDKPGDNKSAGGIITGGDEDKQEVGLVVAAGKGVVNPYSTGARLPVEYMVGDVVFMPSNFGHNFIYGSDREKLLSILGSDIIAKL